MIRLYYIILDTYVIIMDKYVIVINFESDEAPKCFVCPEPKDAPACVTRTC